MKNSHLDVLLINPHLEFPEDTSGRSGMYRAKEYLLNMGLLSIATYLKSIGIEVLLCDLAMENNPIEMLKDLVIKYEPKFVGISNQSCYSYLSTIECANTVKLIDDRVKVIVGGLHVSGIPNIALQECKNINAVVIGEGELALADIIKETSVSTCEKTEIFTKQFIFRNQGVINLDDMTRLDYSLYPNYKLFVPYVEESRGCTGKCAYCISPLVNNGIRIRHPEKITDDVLALSNLYGVDDFHFFLEANNFAVNHKKAKETAGLLVGNNFSWRTESRADTFPVQLLDNLVDAGLKVLDIGLESGSPEMLLEMNKTKDPEEYLECGVRLAEQIARNDRCLLKLNIMLFYGESKSTIKTTRDYIQKINSICPVSLGIGPVRMDPGSEMYRRWIASTDLSRFAESFWGKVHCYPIDLSREISFRYANEICLEFSQEFQTSKVYYEAKRHSQLRYDLSYDDFMAQSEIIPLEERQWSF